MKRKKFLALALAGVMTAVTLTACAPLEVLYDWFFGGGGSASRGSEKGRVTESEELEKQLEKYFGLSETTASARAKETLEAVAKGFDATWLTTNNGLNETAVNALKSITDDKLELTQRLCVDVMELTPSGRTAVMLFPDGDGLGVVSAVVISALPALSLREDFFNLRNFDHCCQRFSAMRLPGSPRLGAWKPMGLSSARTSLIMAGLPQRRTLEAELSNLMPTVSAKSPVLIKSGILLDKNCVASRVTTGT